MFAKEALTRRASKDRVSERDSVEISIQQIKSQLENTSSLMRKMHEKTNAMRKSQFDEGLTLRRESSTKSEPGQDTTIPAESDRLPVIRTVSEELLFGGDAKHTAEFEMSRITQQSGSETELRLQPTNSREEPEDDDDAEMRKFELSLNKIYQMVEKISDDLVVSSGTRPTKSRMQTAAMMSSHQRVHLMTSDPSKKYGLLFGHTNWSQVLALMVAIRAGLKM